MTINNYLSSISDQHLDIAKLVKQIGIPEY